MKKKKVLWIKSKKYRKTFSNELKWWYVSQHVMYQVPFGVNLGEFNIYTYIYTVYNDICIYLIVAILCLHTIQSVKYLKWAWEFPFFPKVTLNYIFCGLTKVTYAKTCDATTATSHSFSCCVSACLPHTHHNALLWTRFAMSVQEADQK